MERRFKQAYVGLNAQQRLAVDTVDGPVLVIAGPGTGKTQLISTRVGYILQKTDTPADAILLLTFTEAGVQAMRERLNQLIGPAAYDVSLSTYHAFGGEIFRRYPDYFEGSTLSLIEDLGSDALLRSLIAKLPYSNPLKFADNYINDIKSFISEAKRAYLLPEDIEQIAQDNQAFIKKANQTIQKTLDKLTVVSKKTVPAFEELLSFLSSQPSSKLPKSVLPLIRYVQGELELALEAYVQTSKTRTLTEWKRDWLAKDEQGSYVIDGARQNQRLQAAGRLYHQYQKSLQKMKLYDYDDMILRAIDVLESNPELKYSLADRYSYIMLDEFQDTNPAQFKLVQLLTDHPVHEGRPNILAVGDDDQAIYAFQGADHANMTEFAKHYKDVKLVNLVENYRSQHQLLEVSKNIAAQIQSRLIYQVKNVNKDLVAASRDLPEPAHINVREFKSDAAQYSWIAGEIKKLLGRGILATEIAVLAPKHRYLEPLLPYLASRRIPVYYERRENVLDEPIVHQLEQMSRLVLALADNDESLANSLWPEVLSYEFWNLPIDRIWSISWQSRSSREPWTAILLNDEVLGTWASFFLRLASLLPTSSLEQQLDALIGSPHVSEGLNLATRSPLYDYHFSKHRAEDNSINFIKLISDLNVLRTRINDWRQAQDQPTSLRSFVEFVQGHRAAEINILNTSPYNETKQAINLLTAYGAKGREFQVVFVTSAADEVWGSASRNQGYRLSLPVNLSYTRYQGASEDERLRLLYVAISRAKTRLYLTSYAQDLAGRQMNRLKYLNISEDEKATPRANVLPQKFNKLHIDRSDSLSLQAAENYWTKRHTPPFNPKLQEVLSPRLKSYKLNVTDLNYFLNIVDYGPDAFFIKCLLMFPSAQNTSSAFGTAIHNSLRFAGNILIQEGKMPTHSRLSEIFEAQLARIDLPADEYANLTERGRDSLKAWLTQSSPDIKPTDRFEYDFQNENSHLGSIQLSGKVDRLIIDEKRRTITVVDYKTGRPYNQWQSNIPKLHIFQRQLIFYKFLLEASARFRKYRVERGIIEFVEPDEIGKIRRLELEYRQEQLTETADIMEAVWNSIQNLKFPDVSAYPQTLTGIKKLESDLAKAAQKIKQPVS